MKSIHLTLIADERRARSARALRIGTLRPAIVLYDESHPIGDDIGTIQTLDLGKKPDLLIIMGTSLKVHGIRKLVKEFARAVHDHKSKSGKVIFVNKTPPATEWDSIFDYYVAADIDSWVSKVLEDWKKSRPQDWEIQKTLFADTPAEQKLVVTKRSVANPKGEGFFLYLHSFNCLMSLYRKTPQERPQCRKHSTPYCVFVAPYWR